MYGWIWRMLPFGLPGKIIGSLVLLVAVVWLLWYHVFPAAEPLLPFDDVQVGEPGGPGGTGTAPPGGTGPSEIPGQPAPSGQPT